MKEKGKLQCGDEGREEAELTRAMLCRL